MTPANGQSLPGVGDTVRVVLEGKVTHAGSTLLEVDGIHTVDPQNKLVKSIEIIKPAKPSVADLPVGSVVKLGNGGMAAVRRVQDGAWFATDGDNYSNSEIDAMDWVLLVEKEAE